MMRHIRKLIEARGQKVPDQKYFINYLKTLMLSFKQVRVLRTEQKDYNFIWGKMTLSTT